MADDPAGSDTGIDTSSPEFKKAAEEWLEGQGIKKALDSEREARKEMEKRLSRFEDVDLDEFKELKAEKEKAEQERARAEGDFEKLLEQERQKFNKELQSRDERMKSLQSSLESALIDSAATKAISKYEGDAELLLPHVRSQTKLMEVDGRHQAVVVDDTGEPRLSPEAQTATDYMGIEHLVGSWKENGKFAGAFAGSGASGGGAPASTRSGGSGAPKKISLDEAARMDPSELKSGTASGSLQVVGD